MSIVDVGVPAQSERSAAHRVGAPVAVRNRYLGTWSPGFEVVQLHVHGCVIRRASDGAVFPEIIPFEDIREPFTPGSRS